MTQFMRILTSECYSSIGDKYKHHNIKINCGTKSNKEKMHKNQMTAEQLHRLIIDLKKDHLDLCFTLKIGNKTI